MSSGNGWLPMLRAPRHEVVGVLLCGKARLGMCDDHGMWSVSMPGGRRHLALHWELDGWRACDRGKGIDKRGEVQDDQCAADVC